MRQRSLVIPTLISIVSFMLFGCRSQSTGPTQQKASNAQTFGAKITPGQEVALAAVLAAPQAFVQKSIIVAGDVRKACSRKGCWMELSTSPDPAAAGCRVTFKDYSFFVPTDSAGAKAKLQGSVELETISPDFVKHLESEGATFNNKHPDGSAESVTFVASGVELTKS